MRHPVWTALALVAGLVGAAWADGSSLEETTADVEAALRDGNYIALSAACERARELRKEHADDELEPLVATLADGIRHRDASLAVLSVKTLGHLANRGSSRYLRRLLQPPRSPAPDRFELHLAAIEAAGLIRDPESATWLEKLVKHASTEIAVAACEALEGFREIDRKPRLQLIRRLIVALGRLEKKRPKTAVEHVHHEAVMTALLDSLRRLTGAEQLSTAAEFRVWLREAEREDPT